MCRECGKELFVRTPTASPMRKLYERLLDRHGPQGWWPLCEPATGDPRYHPRDYSIPRGKRRLEVVVGTVLAQNTSWANVVPALQRLHEAEALDWALLAQIPTSALEELIRSSGHFRQKARKLKEMARHFLGGRRRPVRPDLLAIWGVGPETADSILLYAYGVPVMVVDAYLRRVLLQMGFEHEASMNYEQLRAWVEAQFPPEQEFLNEFHALAVAEGKALGRSGH